jgi:hypothetical protein
MEWINVEKRLPKRVLGNLSDPVLVIIGGNIIIMRCDVTQKAWVDSSGNRKIVTHWMPLPKKPMK